MSGPALVILAAGASSRLGICKALVDLGGRSPLERLLAAGSGLDAAPPLVVTGPHDPEIREAAPPGCEVLENPDWSRGRTGGVQLAHQARAGLDLCLAPVDVPLVPREVFELLAGAWSAEGSPGLGWLAPRCGQRHGHPVVVGRGLLEELASRPPDTSLRQFRLESEGRARLLSVPVLGREVLDDLDTAEDLDRLRRRIGANPG